MLLAIVYVVVLAFAVTILSQGASIGTRESKQRSTSKRFDNVTRATNRISELTNTNIVR